MMALASAAVVDHACSARRQSKGSGPGLVPLRIPAVGGREESAPPAPLPCKESVGSSPRVRGAPGVFSGLSCPRLPSIVVAWVSAFRHCWCRCWCSIGGAAGVVAGVWCVGGGGSILSGVSVAAGDVVSCGTGNQISLNLPVLTGLRPPLVTLSLRCRITCGLVAANISALPLSRLPQISVPLYVCCGVWFSMLLCELVFIRFFSTPVLLL